VFSQEACERDALRNGHYQIEKHGESRETPAIVRPEASTIPVVESPVKQISTDRSMGGVGKLKGRKKGR
jgi:hypothetical protein